MASFIPRFLRQLRDIVIASPTDGQVLTYDSADQKWKNEAGSGGAFPTWWTVNSTPGSESVVFGGAVEVNPGRDVSTLVLRGFAGNTEHILQVFDDDGDLAVDIDFEGFLDARRIVVQDPPDSGSGSSVALNPGEFEVIAVAGQEPFTVRDPVAAAVTIQARASGFGSLWEISPIENDDTSFLIVSPPAPSVDAIQVWDNAFNNTIFAVTATGGLKATLPTSDPAVAGQLWNDGGTVVLSGSTAGSGAPDDANYLVGTANGGLSAEIVVGTSPGGELGGTWASPTVDAIHSGSAHSDFQPVDADLTAIAALATTAFGRGLLILANQAALLSAAGAAAASHAHAGEDVTSGTVADARIASTIARDSEVTSAISALSSVYQPLDSDLTAIAALADPNADRILFWDDSAGAYTFLTPGTNLTITATTIDAAAGGISLGTAYALANSTYFTT